MTQTLEQLSAADGNLKVWQTGDANPPDWDGGDVYCADLNWRPLSAIPNRFDGKRRNCILIYRTGQLAAVADDAMVERVAKAIYDALVQDKESDAWIGSSDQLDAVTIDGDVNLLLCAKAALAAKGTGGE